VVGAGASGTLAAVHLLRKRRARVILIDPDEPGLGVAYSTRDEDHLLNVRACAMSGLAEDPDDFVDWCRVKNVKAGPDDYLPRRLYGVYLQELLERFGGHGQLQLVRGLVDDVAEPASGEGVRLTLTDGRVLSADAAILALGNAPPGPIETIPGHLGAAVIDDPWAPDALSRVAGAGRVAIIGTGLTAVDITMSTAAANPDTHVSAISRHGWLPRAHLPGPAGPLTELRLESGSSLDEILSAVQAAVTAQPDGWRDVVDGLRPHTCRLWQELQPAERLRFDRELRSWWDVHRHRVAPPVAARLDQLCRSRRIDIHAGGVRGIQASAGGGVSVTLGDGSEIGADVVVNATGPARALHASSNPLMRRLLNSGRARTDELGIGFATDAAGALIDQSGLVSRRYFTLGPPRRGDLLESVAVPEIRTQAAQLARVLTEDSDSATAPGPLRRRMTSTDTRV
jgi:uncharacterized NAD(P)/FAD-binding protein YdhS